MSEVKKRTRAKKVTAAGPSVAAAFGLPGLPGLPEPTEAPAIFIEEVEEAPLPQAKAKKTRKPIVASVTPDGIDGELVQRPLIAHMPIHSTDIDTDMFTSVKPEVKADMPNAYDPQDIYAVYGQETPVATVQSKVVTRPSLPLHYSEKLMICFQDSNREQRLPDSTDVACFWDCQSFRGQPCDIPKSIEEGIWRVYGNFCSPECAAAYLFNERLDVHVQWERYALLNRLYSAYIKEEGISSKGVRRWYT